MNRTEHDSSDPGDPEQLLANGLRATTPEFEARFDALRRRLADEPRHHGVVDRIALALRGRPSWLGIATAAAGLALIISLARVRAPHEDAGGIDESMWFAETLALDEALRGALVLADAEAREVVALMPVEPPGGGS